MFVCFLGKGFAAKVELYLPAVPGYLYNFIFRHKTINRVGAMEKRNTSVLTPENS